MTKKPAATSRVAITPTFRRELSVIAASADTKQGEALRMLLELYRLDGESAVELGRRLRREWEQRAD